MTYHAGGLAKYSDIEIEEVWRRHAKGEYLQDICREKGMPSFDQVINRTTESPELSRIAAVAREEFSHDLAKQTIAIADADVDAPRARNRIAARQWLAGKYARQVFGDKVELNVTGSVSVGAALEEARRRVRPISDLSEQALPQVIDLQAETIDAPTDSKSEAKDVDPFD